MPRDDKSKKSTSTPAGGSAGADQKSQSRINKSRGGSGRRGNTSEAKSQGSGGVAYMDPQLLADAASHAYSHAIGSPLEYDTDLRIAGPYTAQSLPGIMAIHTSISPGISTDNTSALNIAARNIYSFVRHANSGHANYDSPDLMMYLLAMDSAYAMFSYAQRVYGIARTYSIVNRYYPKAILSAMGCNPDDVVLHLADLRYALNTLAIKIGSLCVPANMSFVTRHCQQYANIYTDTPGVKHQMYMYVPAGFFIFEETAYPTGSSLRYCYFDRSVHTVQSIINDLNEMIEALICSEDINIMSGDILKAFGAENVMKIGLIDEDYSVLPVFDPEVLMEINNTTCVGELKITEETWEDGGPEFKYSPSNIWQRPDGAIVYNPIFGCSAPGMNSDVIVNMPMDVPAPEHTLAATRLTNIMYKPRYDSATQIWDSTLVSSGTEIAHFFVMYEFWDNPPYNWNLRVVPVERQFFFDKMASYEMIRLKNDDGDPQLSVLHALNALGKFSNHPIVNLVVPLDFGVYVSSEPFKANDPKCYQLIGRVGELGTISTFSESDLTKMHNADLLSRYKVPLMGAWSEKVKR
nr:putative capsid [Marmot picobirnavirus]